MYLADIVAGDSDQILRPGARNVKSLNLNNRNHPAERGKENHPRSNQSCEWTGQNEASREPTIKQSLAEDLGQQRLIALGMTRALLKGKGRY